MTKEQLKTLFTAIHEKGNDPKVVALEHARDLHRRTRQTADQIYAAYLKILEKNTDTLLMCYNLSPKDAQYAATECRRIITAADAEYHAAEDAACSAWANLRNLENIS